MEIVKLNPCEAGLAFRRQFTTFEEAWNACDRADWLMWIAKKLRIKPLLIAHTKLKCAKLAYPIMTNQEHLMCHKIYVSLFFDDYPPEKIKKGPRYDDENSTEAQEIIYSLLNPCSFGSCMIYIASAVADEFYRRECAKLNVFADCRKLIEGRDRVYRETMKKCAEIIRSYISTEVFIKIKEI